MGAPTVHPPEDRLAIQLVRAHGLASHLIAWWGFGWDGYSHADAVLPDGSLLGARSDRIKLSDGERLLPGVRVRPAGYERWERRTLFWRSATPQLAQAWREGLKGKCGTAYDKDGILRLILGRQPQDDGRDFCSCLQLVELQELGVIGDLSVAPQQVSPTALGMVLSALKWNIEELPV